MRKDTNVKMITVEFAYRTKANKWLYGEQYFESIDKAIKFIKFVIPKSKDKVYSGFRCDDIEELEKMERRL